MKRKNKSKCVIIGFFFIIIGIFSLNCKFIYEQAKEQQDKKRIEDFFQEDITTSDEIIIEENNKIVEKKSKVESYVAVLEIPIISLKKGIYDKNSNNNDVNKNIQILKKSDMPDLENGNFILAGHSGTGRIAYFSDLEKIKVDNMIYVYYNEIKYSYKITFIYLEDKDGTISINGDNKTSRIILTTCSQKEKGKQLVVIGDLITKEKY